MVFVRPLYPLLLLWPLSRGFVLPNGKTRFFSSTASQRYRKRFYDLATTNESLQHTRCYAGFKSTPFDDGGWKSGNVYDDLLRLEQGVILARAEDDLQHKERLAMLDRMAEERRPLYPDVKKFLIAPMICALLLKACNEYSSTRLIAGLVTMTMDLHFWAFVVAAPVFFLGVKRMCSDPPEPMPDELKQVDPKYLDLVLETSDWESPGTSCRDNILFLLELWASAVVGMAVVGIIRPVKRLPQYPGIQLWWAVSQLMTRIGAVAALYQFPKQLFRLRRRGRPRPFGFFSTLMRSLVNGVFLMAPIGVAADLSKILGHMGKESVISLYSCISAFMLAAWIKMQKQDPLSFGMLKKPSFAGRIRDTIAVMLFWRKPWRNLIQRVSNHPFIDAINRWQQPSIYRTASMFLSGLLFFTPILGPLCHIFLISEQLRIVHTDDISLSLDEGSFGAAMADEKEMAKRMKWRYRVEWREDKRLGEVLREWEEGLTYWLFIQGSVRDQLEKEKRQAKLQEVLAGRGLLDRLAKDLASTPANTPPPNRDKWKQEAMDRLAKEHQADYENGTPRDPLGIAVQQTLGIGLGFTFDHMRPLEPGEQPSLRRLHARAAKSAIRRVQELRNIEKLTAQTDHILDPKEKKKRKKELREMTRTEIKYLAKKLADLVPPNSDSTNSEYDEVTTQIFHQTTPNYRRTGSHEYRVVDEDPTIDPNAPATSRLLENLVSKQKRGSADSTPETTSSVYDILPDNYNSYGDDEDEKSSDDPVEETIVGTTTPPDTAVRQDSSDNSSDTDDIIVEVGDEEFMEAYLRQKRSDNEDDAADDDNDGDDDGTRMVLA